VGLDKFLGFAALMADVKTELIELLWDS